MHGHNLQSTAFSTSKSTKEILQEYMFRNTAKKKNKWPSSHPGVQRRCWAAHAGWEGGVARGRKARLEPGGSEALLGWGGSGQQGRQKWRRRLGNYSLSRSAPSGSGGGTATDGRLEGLCRHRPANPRPWRHGGGGCCLFFYDGSEESCSGVRGSSHARCAAGIRTKRFSTY